MSANLVKDFMNENLWYLLIEIKNFKEFKYFGVAMFRLWSL